MKRQAFTPLTPVLVLVTALLLVLPGPVSAQSHRPPTEPPDEWGPISINMEEIEYPYPVAFMNFRVYDQDVRLAYMDVAPVGPANGRAVVFHHGGSYYGWYWKAQIEALINEGYRVVVKDRLGWGKSSKPILSMRWCSTGFPATTSRCAATTRMPSSGSNERVTPFSIVSS